MTAFIWPALIFLDLLFVLVLDQGSGLASPGFWLIPIGVVGSIVSNRRKLHSGTGPTLDSSKDRSRLIAVWAVAFFSIVCLYTGWLDSGDGYFWALPALVFTIAGLLLTVKYAINK